MKEPKPIESVEEFIEVCTELRISPTATLADISEVALGAQELDELGPRRRAKQIRAEWLAMFRPSGEVNP